MVVLRSEFDETVNNQTATTILEALINYGEFLIVKKFNTMLVDIEYLLIESDMHEKFN